MNFLPLHRLTAVEGCPCRYICTSSVQTILGSLYYSPLSLFFVSWYVNKNNLRFYSKWSTFMSNTIHTAEYRFFSFTYYFFGKAYFGLTKTCDLQ